MALPESTRSYSGRDRPVPLAHERVQHAWLPIFYTASFPEAVRSKHVYVPKGLYGYMDDQEEISILDALPNEELRREFQHHELGDDLIAYLDEFLCPIGEYDTPYDLATGQWLRHNSIFKYMTAFNFFDTIRREGSKYCSQTSDLYVKKVLEESQIFAPGYATAREISDALALAYGYGVRVCARQQSNLTFIFSHIMIGLDSRGDPVDIPPPRRFGECGPDEPLFIRAERIVVPIAQHR